MRFTESVDLIYPDLFDLGKKIFQCNYAINDSFHNIEIAIKASKIRLDRFYNSKPSTDQGQTYIS